MNFSKTQLAGAIAAVSLIVPAAAFAATINGGPAGERLRGTNLADTINGNGGNDRIRGFAGGDRLNGGAGRDRIFGGAGDDAQDGGPGNDRMSGGAGDDAQVGGPGNDRIFANRGVDVSAGGDGDDVLWALARADVKPGPNGETDTVGDTLDGGSGNDVLRTRDGEADTITCGPGVDRALLDTVDVIADATADNPNGSCEIVKRKAPKAAERRSEDQEETTAGDRAGR
jgi:Ca2+-binding RTX toxin-like protein